MLADNTKWQGRINLVTSTAYACRLIFHKRGSNGKTNISQLTEDLSGSSYKLKMNGNIILQNCAFFQGSQEAENIEHYLFVFNNTGVLLTLYLKS